MSRNNNSVPGSYTKAVRLLELGWIPLPMLAGTKKTHVRNWSHLAFSYDHSTLNWFKSRRYSNIGIIYGDRFVELDVEFACTEQLSKLEEKYGWLKHCPILSTYKGTSVWVRCPELAGRHIRFKDPRDGEKHLLELRSGHGRCRVVYGQVGGRQYSFVKNDPLEKNLTPDMLPLVTKGELLAMLKDLMALSGIGLPGDYWDQHFRPARAWRQNLEDRREQGNASWLDGLLCDVDLFLGMFEKYAPDRPLSRPGKDVLCPFHEENNPSATWYVCPDGVVRFKDFHRHGEDGDTTDTYDVIDCYAAFKSGGPLKRITEPRERVLWAARLAEEFGRLPEKAKKAVAKFNLYIIAIRDLPVLTESDARALDRVLGWLRDRCMAQACLGYDVFGDSVRYIEGHTGIDKAIVNRSIDLACLLGMFEKTEEPSSQEQRRPDRLRLRNTTVRAILDAARKLLRVGVTSLRKLNQNVAYLAFGARKTMAIFRRQSDRWEAMGRLPRWMLRELKRTEARPQPAAVPQQAAAPAGPPRPPWIAKAVAEFDRLMGALLSGAAAGPPEPSALPLRKSALTLLYA